MTSITSNFFSKALSEEERKRLDRQLRLSGLSQEILKKSKVLIVGVGGLGSEIAKNLAAIGVGTIYLCDMDRIEHSNLNRQIIFVDANEGESKAKAAARFLSKINPQGRHVPLPCRLEEIPPVVYKDVDLVISGLDGAQARLNLNRKCFLYQQPLLDGGTREYNGHVYVTWFGKNACLECDPLREPIQEDLAACSLVGEPRKRVHCALKAVLSFQEQHDRLPLTERAEEILKVTNHANTLLKNYFPNDTSFSPDEILQMIDFHEPAIITINAVIASLQSQEALKILHHVHEKPLGSISLDYLIYNGLTGKFYHIARHANPKCLLCGKNAPPFLKIKIDPRRTPTEMIKRLREKGHAITKDYLLTRLENKTTELLEQDKTLVEQGVKDGEIMLLSGIKGSSFPHDDAYLVLYYAR